MLGVGRGCAVRTRGEPVSARRSADDGKELLAEPGAGIEAGVQFVQHPTSGAAIGPGAEALANGGQVAPKVPVVEDLEDAVDDRGVVLPKAWMAEALPHTILPSLVPPDDRSPDKTSDTTQGWPEGV